MISPISNGLLHVFALLFLLQTYTCLEDYERCNKTPLQSKTPPLPPDDRFAIEIIGVENEYIPDKEYTVRLFATEERSSFIAFTISATGSTLYNEKNPRLPIPLSTGQIRSSPNASDRDTISHPVCTNTVIEANKLPKTSVVAHWTAPPKGNQCVTIFAYVAVKTDVWYSSDGPLSKRVCEDHRKAEDMKPKENNNCNVCEEARYELKFQGTWAYNTHPTMFPNNSNARFSDIVGASHNNKYAPYADNDDATEGLKMLAEQGNTTTLENEILGHLGKDVRTVIKATGPPNSSLSTLTGFRTSREHHLISIAASILPSPDWFLGVYNMELCKESGEWTERVVYNLYPMDAGTDNGVTFETSNEPTTPPKVIAKATINGVTPDKPFAKLIINLVRTYESPACLMATTERTVTDDGYGDGNENGEEEKPDYGYETSTSPPVQIVTEDTEGCPTTPWEDWMECVGPCEDDKVTGYRTRLRYFVIDGKIIGKDFEKRDQEPEVPEICFKTTKTSETEKCEDECKDEPEDPEAEAQQRNWNDWVKPGQIWPKLK